MGALFIRGVWELVWLIRLTKMLLFVKRFRDLHLLNELQFTLFIIVILLRIVWLRSMLTFKSSRLLLGMWSLWVSLAPCILLMHVPLTLAWRLRKLSLSCICLNELQVRDKVWISCGGVKQNGHEIIVILLQIQPDFPTNFFKVPFVYDSLFPSVLFYAFFFEASFIFDYSLFDLFVHS